MVRNQLIEGVELDNPEEVFSLEVNARLNGPESIAIEAGNKQHRHATP